MTDSGMTFNDVKLYLEKKLPKFTLKADDTIDIKTGKPYNENKLWIERDGQHIILDVQKVDTKAGAKKLKEFIELKWKGVK